MKRTIIVIVSIIIALVLLYLGGYRFTAESAVKAHSFLEKDSILVQEVPLEDRSIYIYEFEDNYRTIIPEKSLLLWRAPYSSSTKNVNDKNDRVRTIGWASYTFDEEQGTVMVIKVMDDNVAYIEAGPDQNRERKLVQKDQLVIFSWDNALFVHEILPIAYSEDGTELYRYGYPEGTTYLDDSEIRWHKVQ